MPDTPIRRRALGRALSRIANATVSEALTGLVADPESGARRIGVTGPPGAGKSTLVSRLARRRLDRGATVGVVAIDPSSPYTQGAILGDRIRMEHVAEDPRLFIRSLASRSASDGLADNIADVLLTMDGFGFDEALLETVGVGQAEHAVRTLVDTVVLVLVPESGDQIQAMKAGVLETADIYVVNKADLPGAKKIAAELNAVLKLRQHLNEGWEVPVIMTAQGEEAGIITLDEAITRHLAWAADRRDPAEVQRLRTEYHLKSLVTRRVSEVLFDARVSLRKCSLAELYDLVLRRMGMAASSCNGADVEPWHLSRTRAPASDGRKA